MHQLTEQSWSSAGLDIKYVFSTTGANNGRILQRITSETVNYSYDTLNRLTAASSSGGGSIAAWAESFTYDGFGNLTDKTVTNGSAPPLHVTVNANNQINGYSYDANGNLTAISGQFSATYDMENRLNTISPSSGGTEYYAYGPDNLRVYKKMPSGAEELHIYGAYGELLAKFAYSTGATIERRVYFGKKLIWAARGGGSTIRWAQDARLALIGQMPPRRR